MSSQDTNLISVEPTAAEQRVLEGPTEPLTRTERETLLGLERAVRMYGNPSLREIAECSGSNLYYSNVHKYLRQLAAKGYVALPARRYRMRGVRLLHRAPQIQGDK